MRRYHAGIKGTEHSERRLLVRDRISHTQEAALARFPNETASR
jgi:hypothetical protein